MGSNDEFGPDTETIRAWLSKRATYAKDARVIGAPRGGAGLADPSPATPVATPAAPRIPTFPDGPRPDTNDAGRSVLAALGVDADAGEPTPSSADATAAGRSVVDALREESPRGRSRPQPRPARRATRAPSAAPVVATPRHSTPASGPAAAPPAAPPAPAEPTRTPVARTVNDVRISAPSPRSSYQPSNRPPPDHVAPAPQVRTSRWTEPEENLTVGHASTDADFPVRGGVRRALSLVLLASFAATGAMAYVASQDRTPSTIGIAGVLGFLTLMVWAVRAGCVTTELSLRRGQLTIKRGGRTEVVDIASHHTPVAIVGEPGHRRWTVLLERPGLPLVVINASMVDPHWFTSALYRVRPELRPGHVPEADEQYADSAIT